MVRLLIFALLLALLVAVYAMIRRLLSGPADAGAVERLEGPRLELPVADRVCARCALPVHEEAELFETFERMHRRCFHLEYEHDGAEDRPCGDPDCPLRLEQH